MNALVSDFYACFLAPLLILYANPTVWKSIRSLQRTIEHLSFMYPKFRTISIFFSSGSVQPVTPSNNQVDPFSNQVISINNRVNNQIDNLPAIVLD